MDNSETNGKAVAKVFTAFGLELSEGFYKTFGEQGKVFRMGRTPLRIKVLTGISGVDFDSCYNRRGTARFDDIEVDIIGLDDLKANKRASGRTNDIDDLANLP